MKEIEQTEQHMVEAHNCLCECAGKIRALAEHTPMEQTKERLMGLVYHLAAMAHLENEPEADQNDLRRWYFNGLLREAGYTRQKLAEEITTERDKRRKEDGEKYRKSWKKGDLVRFDGRDFEHLFQFNPATGRFDGRAPERAWRDAADTILSKKLGSGYDDIIELIFFPEEKLSSRTRS